MSYGTKVGAWRSRAVCKPFDKAYHIAALNIMQGSTYFLKEA
ncbi:hypothetical protein PYJP_05190 [Pyrofollis japonicus]|nr:hypothetical protein PYJP_05190 [Pyrofollis japonicus]